MKLIDILARELKAWPEGLECLSQLKGTGYIINGKGFDGRAFDALEIADETLIAGAIVTRAEWQAAVEALKSEQAAELKWPDGAEFKGEGSNHFYRNVTSDSFEAWVRSCSQWQTFPGKPSYQPLIPRPTERAVEWDGVGLPPVGAEIEALLQGLGSTTYFWQLAKVVHGALPESGGEILVFSLETTRPAWVDEFRPIRTQEQIAAEERSRACDKIYGVITGDGVERKGNASDMAEALYDAGYRKQVAE